MPSEFDVLLSLVSHVIGFVALACMRPFVKFVSGAKPFHGI